MMSPTKAPPPPEPVDAMFDSLLGKASRILLPAVATALCGLILWNLNHNTEITESTRASVARLETTAIVAASKAELAAKRADEAANLALQSQISMAGTLEVIRKLQVEHDEHERRILTLERKMNQVP